MNSGLNLFLMPTGYNSCYISLTVSAVIKKNFPKLFNIYIFSLSEFEQT